MQSLKLFKQELKSIAYFNSFYLIAVANRAYDAIFNSDAILVLNFDKRDIKNYVGGNTLMEIGFAHVNDKKIFLLNPIPEDVSYVDEIKAMVDNILEDDLNKIN